MTNTHHANTFALHNTTNALDLMTKVARTEGRRRCALMCKTELVDQSVNRSLLRGRSRGDIAVPGVLGVAVYLMLDFFGGTAICFAATHDATNALANACSKTAENLTVLISPTPDTKPSVSKRVSFLGN
jgi:hypothetical protein